MQQNIVSQTEAMEIAMNLESSPIEETGTGMMQIQSHLANITAQIQDINKGKEVQEEIWCTICRTKGHHKDNCSTLMNYVATRVMNLINNQGMSWCIICHTRGHQSEECLYLNKNVSTLAILYCKFVGHDEKYCR